VPPKLLAGVDVRDVHLDEGDGHGGEGVPDRHRRVSEGAGIDDHEAGAIGARGVQPVDDLALVVALEGVQAEPGRGRLGAQPVLDLGQRGAAIDLGLTSAESVQIGAVDDQHVHASNSPTGGLAEARRHD